MLDTLSRTLFLTLAGNAPLKRIVSRYGMRNADSFARRFIAGRDVGEAIATARRLEHRGFLHTFNLLGEHVRDAAAAETATNGYEQVIDAVRLAGLECHVSVKLTQLGLELDVGRCRDNLERILRYAESRRAFIRVDMENSAFVDDTLAIVDTMRRAGHTPGVVLQSALRRTPDDLARVVELGLPVRLCKGAYKESTDVAFPRKADVDRAFVELMQTLLAAGTPTAIATHDPRMIEATCAAATALSLSTDRFEFQMLYGVRRDLQAKLEALGHAVRIYLPFGDDWFAYFMRRLAERPANVLFVVRSLLYEQLGDQRRFDHG